MPDIGEKVRFRPAAFTAEANRPDQRRQDIFDIPRMVTGRIWYINEPHRFYDVEYVVNGHTLHESFKF